MPRRSINRDEIKQGLIKHLKQRGPQLRIELQNALGISQPTVSRIIKELRKQVVQIGSTPNLQYAHKGELAWPIFEMDHNGKISELGELATLDPHLFLISGKVFHDLPYFLFDMRPAGFLGRLIPSLHPELALPKDITLWSSLTTLKYLSHAGLNSPGNLLVGEAIAQQLHLKEHITPATPRSKYGEAATQLLTTGTQGSSATGEQPKFLSTNKDGTHLIVKFSPPKTESVGKRVSDILICEHIAMTMLRDAGLSAAKTELVKQGDRTFLEVERFDRTGVTGRRGVISLGAITAEFLGTANSWSEAADALVRLNKIPEEWNNRIRFFEIFGHLIANSDMHLFNFSFMSKQGTKLLDLAPVYDMCPMAYAPRANQIIPHQFMPPIQRSRDRALWSKAHPLAMQFWNKVAKDLRISEDFKSCARKNEKILANLF